MQDPAIEQSFSPRKRILLLESSAGPWIRHPTRHAKLCGPENAGYSEPASSVRNLANVYFWIGFDILLSSTALVGYRL